MFFLRDLWDSQDVDYYYDVDGELKPMARREKSTYPNPSSRIRPAWLETIGTVDHQLRDILNETYIAYDSESYILTTVGLRTALDRATQILGIESAYSFAEKLTALKNGGWVGETERDIFEVIMNAGNAAAHRAWSPSKDHVEKMLTAMAAFLHRAFIVGKDALEIKAHIPPRQIRKNTE